MQCVYAEEIREQMEQKIASAYSNADSKILKDVINDADYNIGEILDIEYSEYDQTEEADRVWQKLRASTQV